jgi:SAM-dependent methyltransferase
MEISLAQLWQMEMDQLKAEADRNDPDPDIWRWSPFDIRLFDEMLRVARQVADDNTVRIRDEDHYLRRLSIAEAGCGIGTKLYLARNKYDLAETGYDINEEYLARCRELEVMAELRDLADLENPAPWSAFDIVYTARPFKDDKFELKWEKSVQDAMRPGAVLISSFTARKPYSWECWYRRPFCGVWSKPLESAAASL